MNLKQLTGGVDDITKGYTIRQNIPEKEQVKEEDPPNQLRNNGKEIGEQEAYVVEGYKGNTQEYQMKWKINK